MILKTRVYTRTTDGNSLMLFDGRNKQQMEIWCFEHCFRERRQEKLPNGLFRLKRIPSGYANRFAYSQVGYHPAQKKMAVIELDKMMKYCMKSHC